jgi:peptidyl-prolyl cis-trans isomerase A (cyclophilin A)
MSTVMKEGPMIGRASLPLLRRLRPPRTIGTRPLGGRSVPTMITRVAVFMMLAFAAALSDVAATPVVVSDATLINDTGSTPIRNAIVVIDGGRLVAAGPRDAVEAPPGVRIIDATLRFAAPGSLDANARLMLGASIGLAVRHEGLHGQLSDDAVRVELRNGLTRVFDSWRSLQPLQNVRDGVKRLEVAADRLYLEEPSTALGEAHSIWFKMQESGIKATDGIVAATGNITAAYRKLDDLGTVEKRKPADLVALDADSLDDLHNNRLVTWAIKEGGAIERDSLPVHKLLAAPRDTRVIITTELGEIEVELYPDQAPVTVANFLKYVDAGFYRGGTFYRVVTPENQPNDKIKIEVVQGGINPQHTTEAFPRIKLERTKDTGIRHVDGAISMARGEPDSATSAFFICVGDQPDLDYGGMRNPDGQGFAAFGKVVRGMEIVRKIQQRPADEKQHLTAPVGITNVTRNQ